MAHEEEEEEEEGEEEEEEEGLYLQLGGESLIKGETVAGLV